MLAIGDEMRLNYIGVVALMAIGLIGCSKSGSNSGTATNSSGSSNGTKAASNGENIPNSQLTIAVIPKGATHSYWKAMHAGAQAAATKLGLHEMIWKGPIKENDRQSQIQIVQDFVSKGVSGIVLAPLDDKALRQPVRAAMNSHVPVLIVDSGLDSKDYVSFVATNNEHGGEMAGDYLAKLLNGKGKVIMLRYEVGSASTVDREEGFLKAISKFPGIQVVSSNQYGGATVSSALPKAQNLIARFKGNGNNLSINGIFCPNESTAVAMLRVLQDGHYAGKVKFVGFDSAPPLTDAIEKHEMDGLIVQNPYKMGYLGVTMLVNYIHGKPQVKRVDTGATLVTPANIKQPKIQKLVNPPQL